MIRCIDVTKGGRDIDTGTSCNACAARVCKVRVEFRLREDSGGGSSVRLCSLCAGMLKALLP